MIISYNWVKEFIDIDLSAKQVAELLTMSGLEVDSVEKKGKDHIIDIDLTPNKGDCLSILGVARELSAISGKKLKMPGFKLPAQDKSAPVKISIEDRELCGRYAGRVIRGIKVKASPKWMQKRLESMGVRPINNIVDVTNYVMLEYGQPLHAFDLDKLRSGHIRVATPGKKISFSTLDGVKRQIAPDMLMIWDGDVAVAVAGVMGGLESEVSDDTTSIFLESACFNASSVRRTASGLGIKTESSFRFERGIDLLGVDKALDRASFLISELTGGQLCRGVDVFPDKHRARNVKVSYQRVNDLLGLSLSRSRIKNLISRTGAKVKELADSVRVEVPSYRNDIEGDVDIIEEVARLYGYHNIPSHAPALKVTAGHDGSSRKRINHVKQLMCSRGYSEVINYSFMNPDMLNALNISNDDERRMTVSILNPLRQEESLLRSTLLPSLIENLVHNYSRGERVVKIFEVSRVFIKKSRKSDKLPDEGLRIGGLLIDDRSQQLWKSGVDPYYKVKGDMDSILNLMSVENMSWKRSVEPFLHGGRSADLLIKGKKTGYIGVLSPGLVEGLGIKLHGADVLVFELDLESVMSTSKSTAIFEKFSRFPFVRRDISLLVDAATTSQDILEEMKGYRNDLIQDIEVFDRYSGKGIPEGKASYGLGVTYRSFDRTLSEEEIDSIHDGLVEWLLERTSGEIRA